MTEKGRALAESVYEKRCFLTGLLISIGVNPQTAEEDACRMEHCISDATFDALKKFYREAKIKNGEIERTED